MLPDRIEDYVGADAAVRVIDAFVDRLNMAELGFQRAVAPSIGRPSYDPRDLLKLYIYGYFNEVRSSRRLERECRRNVEAMWLMRRLVPDFKTVADFRRDNGSAIVGACRAFVLICRDAGLFTGPPCRAGRLALSGRGKREEDPGPARDRGGPRPPRSQDRRLSLGSGYGRRQRAGRCRRCGGKRHGDA